MIRKALEHAVKAKQSKKTESSAVVYSYKKAGVNVDE